MSEFAKKDFDETSKAESETVQFLFQILARENQKFGEKAEQFLSKEQLSQRRGLQKVYPEAF